MLRTLNGIKVMITTEKGRIFWASDWAKIWNLVDAGLVHAVNGGPGTYGHVDFYVV